MSNIEKVRTEAGFGYDFDPRQLLTQTAGRISGQLRDMYQIMADYEALNTQQVITEVAGIIRRNEDIKNRLDEYELAMQKPAVPTKVAELRIIAQQSRGNLEPYTRAEPEALRDWYSGNYQELFEKAGPCALFWAVHADFETDAGVRRVTETMDQLYTRLMDSIEMSINVK
ncbi:hypothetical protein A2154_03870 [Candidatus Gottesmanbacteria bacterium RBG_16_43_7]|uniref:Uncharacterized protein n=1 Tax=Candidatus Gottesmanbacteria bacterium RBG_16_43_7 TaxID=1798373 RepID=A0A1F5Z8Y4_9BACT|nr:MAG: hypothetical protein A2154_03870 [Candidatus Gottesmanbacteria bacterium RBG_16_43_7]